MSLEKLQMNRKSSTKVRLDLRGGPCGWTCDHKASPTVRQPCRDQGGTRAEKAQNSNFRRWIANRMPILFIERTIRTCTEHLPPCQATSRPPGPLHGEAPPCIATDRAPLGHLSCSCCRHAPPLWMHCLALPILRVSRRKMWVVQNLNKIVAARHHRSTHLQYIARYLRPAQTSVVPSHGPKDVADHRV